MKKKWNVCLLLVCPTDGAVLLANSICSEYAYNFQWRLHELCIYVLAFVNLLNCIVQRIYHYQWKQTCHNITLISWSLHADRGWRVNRIIIKSKLIFGAELNASHPQLKRYKSHFRHWLSFGSYNHRYTTFPSIFDRQKHPTNRLNTKNNILLQSLYPGKPTLER